MKNWEPWLLVGLLAALAYQAGNVIVGTVNVTMQSVIDKLAYGIALAEGFFRAGSRPQQNHNPGDFERDITGKGIGWDGPYVVYANDNDGWEALKKQVSLMFGGSSIYNRDMTISQVAFHYADGEHDPQGAENWAANVAAAVGVTPDTKLSEIV